MTSVATSGTVDPRRVGAAEPELSLPAGDAARLEGEPSSSDMLQTSSDTRLGWPVVDWLPVPLAVGLPIPTFRVRDLLTLEVGSIVSTQWPNGDDLPLSAGAVQLAWVDMETVEQSMAVRLTRLL